jgi:predicted secreted protein
MKELDMKYFLSAVWLILFAMPAPAADMPAPGETIVRLVDGAHRMVVQDRIRAVLRVEAGDPDARQAQAEVNRRMTAAIAKTKEVAAVTVETGRYYVYEDRPANRPRRWVGTQTMTLTSADATAALALVGQLQADGLLVSALGYELSPEQRRRVERELIPDAIRQLQDKVAVVADAMAMTKSRIIELRLREGAPPQMPMRAMQMAAGAAERASPPPVAEPGEVTVSIQVEADVMLSK